MNVIFIYCFIGHYLLNKAASRWLFFRNKEVETGTDHSYS